MPLFTIWEISIKITMQYAVRCKNAVWHLLFYGFTGLTDKHIYFSLGGKH